MLYLLLTWLFFPLLWLRAAIKQTSQPTNVAVVQTAKIGDFVCTTPLFREVKRRYPACRLVVIGHAMNAPLARFNPHVDEFVELPSGGLRGFSGRWWLANAFSTRNIDTVICVSPSTAAFVASLWAGVCRRLAVLPNYGGSSYRYAAPFLTHGVLHEQGRLLLETEWRLLSHLDIVPLSSDKEAWSAPHATGKAAMILAGATGPFVGLGVSSGNKLKELGKTRLTLLAERLLATSSASLVLIGGLGDQALAASLVARLSSSRVIDAAGQLSLDELPALLKRLSLYVGVDSGITYLAEASGVPVVDIMGPADACDQRPTGPHALVLSPNVPCAPCSHAFHAPYRCAVGTRVCIKEVDMEWVVREAIALLERQI